MAACPTETNAAEADDPAGELRRELLRVTIRGLADGRLPPDEARTRLAVGQADELIDALISEYVKRQGGHNRPLPSGSMH